MTSCRTVLQVQCRTQGVQPMQLLVSKAFAYAVHRRTAHVPGTVFSACSSTPVACSCLRRGARHNLFCCTPTMVYTHSPHAFSASHASIHSLYTSMASDSLCIFVEKRSPQMLQLTEPTCASQMDCGALHQAPSLCSGTQSTLSSTAWASHLAVPVHSGCDALVGVAERAVERDVQLRPHFLGRWLGGLAFAHLRARVAASHRDGKGRVLQVLGGLGGSRCDC